MRKNWLHIDLKGAIPTCDLFLQMLSYWRDCGFNGLVLEYDDRIPWRSWPQARNHGYSMAEQAEIVITAQKLGFEAVPLIQIHGHLEWLLKLNAYSHWRENGAGNEICPLCRETKPRFRQWIDEVAELHPGSRYIHLGGDETRNLGTCPQCRRHDKMELYLTHVSNMCRYALSKGLRPLLWADMFVHSGRIELTDRLPEGVILVDWRYDGAPPYDSTDKLLKTGREIMGASATMKGWWEHCYRVQVEPQARIDNVTGWNRYGDTAGIGIIHTTWTRPGSLWNMSSPWLGAVPAFIAAGNPKRWASHPWREFVGRLTGIMERDVHIELKKTAEDVLALPASNSMERESRRWWNLALRYQALQKQFMIHHWTQSCLDKVACFAGRDDVMYRENCIDPFIQLNAELDEWETEARHFWNDNKLSNEDEYFAVRCETLREQIKQHQQGEINHVEQMAHDTDRIRNERVPVGRKLDQEWTGTGANLRAGTAGQAASAGSAGAAASPGGYDRREGATCLAGTKQ